MILPIFMLAIISFMDFFEILNYQNIMGHNANQAALTIGRYSYALTKIDNFSNATEILQELGLSEQLLETGINTGYAWNKIFTEELKVYTEKVDVTNGIKGISIITSDFDKSGNGINDIRINYRISANVLGNKNFGFRLSNRCYFRSWIGKSIVNNIEGDTVIPEKVYITKNGKVYHLTKNCTHINIVVTKVMKDKIDNFRNSNGAKYYPCESCTKNSNSTNKDVYITAEGKRYHYNKECGKIERTVIEIDKSDVGEKELCSRCRSSVN